MIKKHKTKKKIFFFTHVVVIVVISSVIYAAVATEIRLRLLSHRAQVWSDVIFKKQHFQSCHTFKITS